MIHRTPLAGLALAPAIAVAIGVLTLGAATAAAHQTDRAELIADVDGQSGAVEVLLLISAKDMAHHLGHLGHGQAPTPTILDEAREAMIDYLDSHLGVLAQGRICQREESRLLAYPGADGRVHYYQQWQCPTSPQEVTFVNRIMVDTHGGYSHHGRIQVGEDVLQTVFDRHYPTYAVYPEGDDQGLSSPPVGDDPMPRTSFFGGGWTLSIFGSMLLIGLAFFLAVRKFWSAQSQIGHQDH